MHLGCVKRKAAAPARQPSPCGLIMKVFAAIATVAPGTSTDRLGKQTAVVLGKTHHAGLSVTGTREGDERAGKLQGERLR